MVAVVSDRAEIFGAFAKGRRERANFETWEAFSSAADIGPATTYRILSDGPDEAGTRLASRNAFARGLGFDGWWLLLTAFEEWLKSRDGNENGASVRRPRPKPPTMPGLIRGDDVRPRAASASPAAAEKIKRKGKPPE